MLNEKYSFHSGDRFAVVSCNPGLRYELAEKEGIRKVADLMIAALEDYRIHDRI